MSRVIERRNQIRNEDASGLPKYLKAQGYQKRLRLGVQANNVIPLRSQKAGRFEKLLGFARSQIY